MDLITFDFHNTIAHCDSWFRLEVHTLVSSVATRLGIGSSPTQLDAAYRALRADVMATGNEVTAYDAATLVLRQFGHAPARQTVIDAVDALMREAMTDLRPVPGAIETIRFLRASGARLGVVSSAAHHDFLEWALAVFDVRDAFAFVLSSADFGLYKSNPEIYRHAMRLGGAEPARSLHLGDSLKWDVESAQQAGMHTAWLRSPNRYEVSAVPDIELETLEGAGPVIAAYVAGVST